MLFIVYLSYLKRKLSSVIFNDTFPETLSYIQYTHIIGGKDMRLNFQYILAFICSVLTILTVTTPNSPTEIHTNYLQVTPDGIIQKEKNTDIGTALKIAQISDLHIKESLDLSQFLSSIELLKKEEPDLICFTGDFFDANNIYSKDTTPIVEALQSLTPPYGKFAVLGNHDTTKKLGNKSLDILVKGGFTVLQDDKVEFTFQGEPIVIAGISSVLAPTSTRNILDTLTPDKLNILLVHEPDIILALTDYPIQLQLSGHTHGGQIKFKNKPITTPPLGEKYVDGPYKINDTLLNVNIGIGYSRMNIRLNCPSTIDFLYLNPLDFTKK